VAVNTAVGAAVGSAATIGAGAVLAPLPLPPPPQAATVALAATVRKIPEYFMKFRRSNFKLNVSAA
jgi:hypothetical protein